jgi:hypothetical protein
MSSKVFISWSGELSKQLAEALRLWLPAVLQFVKPYFTPDDIEKGTRWSSDISSELGSSNIGLICLTKDNISNPWILFESGALSKNFDKAHVCTILFNLEPSDITGPLTGFQATKFIKDDFKKLLMTINSTDTESQLSPDVINNVFEMWWPKLEERVAEILREERSITVPKKRTERDILEEILELSRLNIKNSPNKVTFPMNAFAYLLDNLSEIQEIALLKYKDEGMLGILSHLEPAIKDICFEMDMPELYEKYKMKSRKGRKYLLRDPNDKKQ